MLIKGWFLRVIVFSKGHILLLTMAMEELKSTISGPSLGSYLPHIFLPISMIFGLASQPFKGRGVFWSSLIAYLAYKTLIDDFPTDKQLRYALSTSWIWYVPTLQKLLCSEPEQTYWRLDKQPAEAARMRFGLQKIRWAASLWSNPRGIGWNYQTRRLRPPAYSNNQRFRFILGQILGLLQYYLVVEAALLYLSTFSSPDILDNVTWDKYVLIGVVSGILIYASWQVNWTTGSILSVAMRLSQPEVCLCQAQLLDFAN